MLRALLIYLSQAGWARRLVTSLPIAWRTASRFVAGEALSDAIRVVSDLNGRGIRVTLDHLGEHTREVAQASQATDDIVASLDAIQAKGLQSGVSLKLTQIGLAIDFDMCEANLVRILTCAKALSCFVRIDMEESEWVDSTLKLFDRVRYQHGFEGVGLVIQSYLYRSRDDVDRLTAAAAPVRLCKGAYNEPPARAFPKKADVDANFDTLAEKMLKATLLTSNEPARPKDSFPPLAAFATHDEKRVDFVKNYAKKLGLHPEAFEFQLLYGIRRELQERLVAEGYPVRIYVPYGTEWYPYFMRRLAERPANLWFFVSNLFRN